MNYELGRWGSGEIELKPQNPKTPKPQNLSPDDRRPTTDDRLLNPDDRSLITVKNVPGNGMIIMVTNKYSLSLVGALDYGFC
ncbi:hypothetical protein [Microcystis aeruginosa]|uniref:Uncharacterized protein n=2 Tax=Microcystis TaxID=1125 RepID=A0A552HFF1_MICVR|nr:hypothetical protein [Microcystis aeruginosa]TRU69944.1 MAG: hypothetical protein EWV77_17760 [Microcystis viridis Mv_BB_P_19951000_S68D]TRU76599.1 MAG: hypothetical protein EWV47_05880 [Microcystis viridis Mv_BB_P_19951000_S68]TRU78195.1 MAG: hypothetical protein EWV55_03235 [Microcystis viridis Mv_BB_P_19951000_S69]TRU85732.1 MAG: hypothetical protein EWV46_11980 [Microcystis viridis Mv_BB_P_19951000_S69D]QGZ90414.1 hypothetical protein GQR42_13565 [Microcystis aeruginosa FD4]